MGPPGPFQDLANAVNIDFLRILRLAGGAQKKGEGEEIGQGHSRSLRSHYLLENVYAGEK